MSSPADPNELARAALAGTMGGRRPGAGRKKGSKDKPGHKRPFTPRRPRVRRDAPEVLDDTARTPGPMVGDADLDDLLTPPSGPPQQSAGDVENLDVLFDPVAVYAAARARKEAAQAALAELKLSVESGKYLPREDYMRANATAQQAIAQSVRAIPDTLERKAGLAPEVASFVGELIEEALGALSETMAEFFNKYENGGQ